MKDVKKSGNSCNLKKSYVAVGLYFCFLANVLSKKSMRYVHMLSIITVWTAQEGLIWN